MSKKINDKAELMVPYDAYIQMRIFAKDLWNEVKELGKDEVPCYGYYEKAAEELGIDEGMEVVE